MERPDISRRTDSSEQRQPMSCVFRRIAGPSVAVLCLCAAVVINACSGNNSQPPPPPFGQWACQRCAGMTLNGDGSFTFPDSNGVVGYIYTARYPKQGQTITLNFTLSGAGTVVPSPASGPGSPQLRLFLWENGDDMTCNGQFASYRWWSNPGAASLSSTGSTVLAVKVDPTLWTNCIGQHDNAGFANALSNLLGAGFTFGAEFFGHGVYANGPVAFKVNSFTVQ